MAIRKRFPLVRLICEAVAVAAVLMEAVEMIIEVIATGTTMIGIEDEGAIRIGIGFDITTIVAEAKGAMVGAVEGGRRTTIVGGAIVIAATMGAGVGVAVDMNMNVADAAAAAAAIGDSQVPPVLPQSARQLQLPALRLPTSNHPGRKRRSGERKRLRNWRQTWTRKRI
jgi:hypothetical protein